MAIVPPVDNPLLLCDGAAVPLVVTEDEAVEDEEVGEEVCWWMSG
jgi:hypothetical protein